MSCNYRNITPYYNKVNHIYLVNLKLPMHFKYAPENELTIT